MPHSRMAAKLSASARKADGNKPPVSSNSATQLWATVLLFNVSKTKRSKCVFANLRRESKVLSGIGIKKQDNITMSPIMLPSWTTESFESEKKCFQQSSLDSVSVTVIHFPTGGCINLPPHSFHWYSFKWVSSLPPYTYAWELLSFGIEWAWSLCDSLCPFAWNIGIGKCYAICMPVSDWGVCVFVCTEGQGDQVLRSIAAAGKLKCHYWFPAALGAKAVCGWLSDNLAWLMRVRSRAHAAEMSRRSNTCSLAAKKRANLYQNSF